MKLTDIQTASDHDLIEAHANVDRTLTRLRHDSGPAWKVVYDSAYAPLDDELERREAKAREYAQASS